MARRKLSRQQIERIKHRQRSRLEQTAQEQLAETDGERADIPRQQGLVISHYGATLDVEDTDGKIYRCQMRQNLEDLVCGDRVMWHKTGDDAGVVEALCPRRTLLCRPDFQQRMKPIAANIDQIMVTAAITPELSTRLIDRYLVAAEHTAIRPVIVINKIDLLSDDDYADLKRRLHIYTDIGYQVLYASVKRAHGLDELTSHLINKTSIFAGHSGVGKSSLIKALLPHQEIIIGELSEATGKGTHTTTRSVLYHLPGGGQLIDSPGIREFGLWDITPEQVDQGFIEFRPYLGECRFRNCRHLNEPDCAIQQAAGRGEISQERLESYISIVNSLQETENK